MFGGGLLNGLAVGGTNGDWEVMAQHVIAQDSRCGVERQHHCVQVVGLSNLSTGQVDHISSLVISRLSLATPEVECGAVGRVVGQPNPPPQCVGTDKLNLVLLTRLVCFLGLPCPDGDVNGHPGTGPLTLQATQVVIVRPETGVQRRDPLQIRLGYHTSNTDTLHSSTQHQQHTHSHKEAPRHYFG